MAREAWRDDIELAYPSKYVGCQHLKGREVTFTISRVERPELEMFNTRTNRTTKERRVRIEFEELRQNRSNPDEPEWLLCNKTNARTIKRLYGGNVDEWIGKRVTLYPEKWRIEDGEQKYAVRIKPRRPADAGRVEPEPEPEPEPAGATSATTPSPAEESANPYADEVRSIMKDLGRAAQEPSLMVAIKERIRALPSALPDRALLVRSFKRLEASLAHAPPEDER